MSKPKRTIILVSTLIILPLGAGIWLEVTIRRVWNDAARRLDALRRETLRRQPSSGDWAEYDRALQLVSDTPPETLDQAGQSVLGHLSTALLAPVVAAPSKFAHWDSSYFAQLPQGVQVLALSRSRRLSGEGRHRDAAKALFDFLRFAQDLSVMGIRNIDLTAFALGKVPLEDLHLLITTKPLSADDLAVLEDELDQLDRRFPPYLQSDLHDIVRYGDDLLSSKPLPSWLSHVTDLRQWRFLYSERLLMAAAIREADDAIRLAIRSEDRPFAEAQREFGAISADLRASRNPLSVCWVNSDSGRMTRQRRAEIRLLRIAARYRRAGEVLDLEDPLGGRLLHERSGSRLKAWSATEEYAANLVNSPRRLTTPPLTIVVER